jgi:heme-degrading monooxygenase HmoA
MAVFRAQAKDFLSDIRGQDGSIHAEIARQAHADGGEEVIVVGVWRDLEAIYRWLGVTDLLATRLPGHGEPDVFESSEVQHYEVLDLDESTVFAELRGSSSVVLPPSPAAGLDG